MSYTWSQFKQAVIRHYGEGAQDIDAEAAAIQAVALAVKAAVVREYESDIPLARSFDNDYKAAKVRLAGHHITSSTETVLGGVQDLITVYANVASLGTYIYTQTARAISDFNGTAKLFDSLMLQGVLDLQRGVDCYRQRETTELEPDDFTHNGSASIAPMPKGARPYRLLYENEPEEDEKQQRYVMTPISWRVRELMASDRLRGLGHTHAYAIAPTCEEFWVWPKVEDGWKVSVEWDDVKQTFAGNDVTKFDDAAAMAVALYVRSFLLRQIQGSQTEANTYLNLYQAQRKRLWQQCDERKRTLL
jgi:hypothetical protein